MTTTLNILGQEVEITYASKLSAGFGHYEVSVELLYNGEFKTFTAKTPLDGVAINNLETQEEKYNALYESIQHKIDDEVTEWVNSLK